MPLGDTTADTLLGGRVQLTQPRRGYRAGIDPVLLAAAVEAETGAHVVDAGSGVGAAALCLAARRPDLAVIGLEIDPDQVALAERNAEASGLAGRVSFRAADLLARPRLDPVDHLLTNPPYLDAEAATAPPDPARARAHVAASGGIGAWLAACLRLLRPGGGLTLIHRADALAEVLAGLGDCGAIEVIPLWPGVGKPAKRMILRARKGSRAPLTLHPGLVLHQPGGGYTAAAEAVLRHAARLPADGIA